MRGGAGNGGGGSRDAGGLTSDFFRMHSFCCFRRLWSSGRRAPPTAPTPPSRRAAAHPHLSAGGGVAAGADRPTAEAGWCPADGGGDGVRRGGGSPRMPSSRRCGRAPSAARRDDGRRSWDRTMGEEAWRCRGLGLRPLPMAVVAVSGRCCIGLMQGRVPRAQPVRFGDCSGCL